MVLFCLDDFSILLLVAGIFYLYYKWNKIRYFEKLKFKEEELKHQKKILEIELKAKNDTDCSGI